jgi:hypothetical protein
MLGQVIGYGEMIASVEALALLGTLRESGVPYACPVKVPGPRGRYTARLRPTDLCLRVVSPGPTGGDTGE